MLPSQDFGTIKPNQRIELRDFATLMPRPGWKEGLVSFAMDL